MGRIYRIDHKVFPFSLWTTHELESMLKENLLTLIVYKSVILEVECANRQLQTKKVNFYLFQNH